MHIMSRTCQKLQLCALVGRFGSQNAMVGRLDDLGAGMLVYGSYIQVTDPFGILHMISEVTLVLVKNYLYSRSPLYF